MALSESDIQALDMYQELLSFDAVKDVTGYSKAKLAKMMTQYGYDEKRFINEQDVINSYLAGNSLTKVASAHKVSPSTISRILSKHNVDKRNYAKILPEDEVVKNYAENPTLAFWAGHYGVDESVIRRILVSNNVEIVQVHTKYDFDHDIFAKIDSEESAYWLGFLFADGCVASNTNDVSISLADKDIDHVQKFCDFVGYDKKLTRPYISIRSAKMKEDLIKHGCIPRKTHADVHPIGVPKKYIRHLARGVCDGDGYVGVYSKSGSIEIVGQRTMLAWLVNNGLESDVRPHKSIWRIRSRRGNVLDWGRYLYKDANIYLDRKYEKYVMLEGLLGE